MKQLHPKAMWLFFLKPIASPIIFFWLIWMAVAVSSIGVAVGGAFPVILPLIPVVIIFFLILDYIWAKLAYKFYRYALTEEGFRKESGVIWKHYVTIPYSRIQNVDIYRGVIDRILGLSDLNIQTAGISGVGRYGKSSEGRLPGLSIEDAEKLRDELIHRVRNSRDQGL